MATPHVRCPACNAKVAAPGTEGRFWCTSCDEVFEVHDLPPDPVDPEPIIVGRASAARRGRERRDEPRAPRERSQAASSNRPLVLALAGLGLFATLALGGVGAYFALRKDEPKGETAAKETGPPPKPELPKVQPPPKNVPVADPPPPKVEPKSPTPEEVVRRVKAATVYVRATHPAGVVGMGTGFFAGGRGFVVTNAHVVGYGPREIRRPDRIEVVVNSGEAGERTLPAKVYGVDAGEDLALLEVGAADLPAPLAFGKAAELVETNEVVIYGYPFGELLGKNISVNRSTVSSLRKEDGRLVLVQLAGGLNPGNSGGPVTNVKGEVVGVSVAKLRGAETIGFAIPAETAALFVRDQHRSGGRFETGSLVAVGPNPARPPARPPVRSPVRPPVDPNPAAPLVLPPVKPIPITPAEVAAAGTEVKLPAEGDGVCVGGGGRFLIVTLPKVKQVAVFDASQAKVVKYLPMASDKALVAAGMDRLAVAYPGTNVIQRWNLTTFEKEVTATLPTTAGLTLTNIAMGSATNGPLLVQALDWPRLGEWFVFDITTMKEVKAGPERHGPLESRVGDKVRASNDGRTVVVTRPEGGASILTMNGARWAEAHTPWRDRWPVFPSADGNTVYGAGEMCTPGGKRLGEGGRGSRYYVPALHGPLVLAITDKQDVHDERRGFSLAVHAPRDARPMFQLPAFESIRSLFVPNVGWSIDGHVFFIPQAEVVAVLPRGKDRIVLYKVDVDEELKKTDIDYLFVASHPPPAVPGKRFEYRIDARSKKGEVKYKLEFGPDGLAVAADGKVTWDAPADFARPESVAVTVSDKSGQEIIHTFELTPAAK